jgi:hypothetical protein
MIRESALQRERPCDFLKTTVRGHNRLNKVATKVRMVSGEETSVEYSFCTGSNAVPWTYSSKLIA